MQSKHKKRICIVTRSLSEGGADRVASLQSILLSDLGYQVYIVTVLNSISYPYKGELFNLGEIKEKKDTFIGRLQRLLLFRKFIKEKHIDIVIDHRVRTKVFSEYILSYFVYTIDTIYVVHNYSIERYFPPIKWLTKIIYGRSKAIVSVSKTIQSLVFSAYGFRNLETIYNPVDFNYLDSLRNEPITLDSPIILWYGRLEDKQKNLMLLIEAYKMSKLPSKEVKLFIMGDGKDKNKIEQKIRIMKLNNVVQLLPFSTNPFLYIQNSIYTVLSSRYEGFPMTVLESLACETPVVSVKYKNYEDGILKHGINGLLVDDKSPAALAEGLNRFVEDEELYLHCKKNARKSVKSFGMESIAFHWKKLIEA